MTVEPVLGEGPGDRHRGQEKILQEEEAAADEKSLRLKGNNYYLHIAVLDEKLGHRHREQEKILQEQKAEAEERGLN